MAKSKSVVRKNTKRPTAVQRHVKSLRLPADLAQQIDRWAKAMGEDSHSEAMRHLFEIGLSAADRSAPMPIAPVPQGDLRGMAKPKTGIDPLADEQPGGLDCPDRPEDKKLWLRVPTPSAHRSELWKGAMRPPRVTYDWNPIESAPLDEDVSLQVTDGRGAPYTLRWPCRRTARGWINSRKGTPLEVTPVRWKPYLDRPPRPPRPE
jgi:hypothetical protein